MTTALARAGICRLMSIEQDRRLQPPVRLSPVLPPRRFPALQGEKGGFAGESAGVAGERASRAEHAVAGDDDGDRIAADRPADGPGGAVKRRGQPAVGHGLPVGDVLKQGPHPQLEGRAEEMKGRREVRNLSGEIEVQPSGGGGKQCFRIVGCFRIAGCGSVAECFRVFAAQGRLSVRFLRSRVTGRERGAEVGLSLEPEAGQAAAVRGEKYVPQRGVV